MNEPEEMDYDDLPELSDEEAEQIFSEAPQNVRDAVTKQLDEQMAEMIHRFEAHALAYEKEHPETAP